MIRASIEALITVLVAQQQRLDAEIATVIAADVELARRDALVQSVPGIGPVLSAVLLAGLPELGVLGTKSIAKALYQAVLTARQGNPVIRAHYQQLCQRRPPKVACARRLLGILSAMLRDGVAWDQTDVARAACPPVSA